MVDEAGEAVTAATRSEWWLRRRSEGYLYWHVYKTDTARRKWARLYLDQDDAIWMNEDGSSDGLSFLRDEEMVTSV